MDWDGERDLTADEAAEYIEKNCVAAKIIPFDFVGNWYVIKVERDIKHDKEWRVRLAYGGNTSQYVIIGRGPTPTIALNSAARAVRSKG